jgi:hypothetical protein
MSQSFADLGIPFRQLNTGPNRLASATYARYGHPLSLTFGNGLVGASALDTDYHVASMTVAPSGGPALVGKALSWTGETLDTITDERANRMAKRSSFASNDGRKGQDDIPAGKPTGRGRIRRSWRPRR